MSENSIGVIGGGIIGSWTALHLQEAGNQTTLIEQFPLPHTRGSSHGGSRAFRFLGDDNLAILDYSLDRWRGMETEASGPLFIQTGLLNLGPADDPYLVHHLGVLRDAGRETDWLEAADIASRYPDVRYPPEWGAAWDPGGGLLLAGKCVAAVQERFRSLGGRIVTAGVKQIRDTGRSVTVETTQPGVAEPVRMEFRKVAACLGPWTGRLFPQMSSILRTVKIPVTYWEDPFDAYSVAKGFPIIFNARLTDVYGFPSFEYPGLVKILVHSGPDAKPDSRDLADLQPFIDVASDYVRKHLPLLRCAQPAVLEPCMYTVTPDETPIMDRVSPNVAIGCGYSGSGFKHSPASGRLLAALTLGIETDLPQEFKRAPYTLARFPGRVQSESRPIEQTKQKTLRS